LSAVDAYTLYTLYTLEHTYNLTKVSHHAEGQRLLYYTLVTLAQLCMSSSASKPYQRNIRNNTDNHDLKCYVDIIAYEDSYAIDTSFNADGYVIMFWFPHVNKQPMFQY
jgi:hypothetical protein